MVFFLWNFRHRLARELLVSSFITFCPSKYYMILKFTLVLRKKAKAQFMCFFWGVSLLAFWKHICVFSENSGFSTQIIHFHRDFHYKSSILGVSPLFLKTPKIWEPPGAEKQKRKTPVCSSRLWRRTNQKQLWIHDSIRKMVPPGNWRLKGKFL